MSDHAFAHNQDGRVAAHAHGRTRPRRRAGPSAERCRQCRSSSRGAAGCAGPRRRGPARAALSAIVGARAGDVEAASGLVWLLPPLTLVLMAVWGSTAIDRAAARGRHRPGHRRDALPTIAVIALAALLDPTLEPAPLVGAGGCSAPSTSSPAACSPAAARARAGRLISKPTLIVGAGVIGSHVERRLDAQPQLGLEPVGYLDPTRPRRHGPDRQAPVLGSPADLGRGRRHGRAPRRPRPAAAPDHELIPLVRE